MHRNLYLHLINHSHAETSGVIRGLQKFNGDGFQRRTFPFLWVSELSPCHIHWNCPLNFSSSLNLKRFSLLTDSVSWLVLIITSQPRPHGKYRSSVLYHLHANKHVFFAKPYLVTFVYLRFEVFTAVTMKNTFFWDVKSWTSYKNRCIGATYRFYQ
jgi:hypothetical protein